MTTYLQKIPFSQTTVLGFITKRAFFKDGNLDELKTTLERTTQLNNIELLIPTQTHSANCEIIEKHTNTQNFDNTDALITNITEKVLCIKTADCAPILLFNSKLKVIAAIHSGWKGTAQNIVGKTLEKMAQHYSCDHEFTEAFIGPCIGHKNYEVGQIVYDAFQKLDIQLELIFTKVGDEKYLCNISEANRQLLIKYGVKENNMIVSGECTFEKQEKYYSARRDGFSTGRMISGIVLT